MGLDDGPPWINLGLHFLSFSFIFFHFLAFSFIFFHFPSFSFIFIHFLSFSFIFIHFLSFSFIFFFLSFYLFFFLFLFLCWVLKIWFFLGLNFVQHAVASSPKRCFIMLWKSWVGGTSSYTWNFSLQAPLSLHALLWPWTLNPKPQTLKH